MSHHRSSATPKPTRRSLRPQTASTPTATPQTGPVSRREARVSARARSAALPTEAIQLVQVDAPVEVRVEPVIVAEPLLDAESAAEPATVVDEAIDTNETAELVDAMVEDGPAHTILDDAAAAADDDADEARAQVDAFAEAARAFAFTGELVTVVPVAYDDDATVPAPADRMAPRRTRRAASLKRLATASVSVGAMAIVGLLTVGLTTPAEAVGDPIAADASETAGDVGAADIQAYVVPSTISESALDRTESYSTGTMIDLAGTEGITNYSSQYFTNDLNCPIQWPFATGTTISYGFGMRDGRMHEGVDFTPGDGAHIQAVADGVVSTSTDSGGMYGVTVTIDVVVDGTSYSIRYGHMQYGSRQVEVGDHVEVGEYLGRTGDTGYSFGAHTHVEVLQNGSTPIDPMPWFEKYATC